MTVPVDLLIRAPPRGHRRRRRGRAAAGRRRDRRPRHRGRAARRPASLAGRDTLDLGRRRGAPARPGRLARARLRARPHRVGGLRQRHPGRRGGRDHHPGRHAAGQRPGHGQRGRAAGQAAGGRRPVPRRRGVLGRGHPGQHARARTAGPGRGRRVQVLPGRLRVARLPAGGRRPADRGAAHRGAGSAGRCWSTPKALRPPPATGAYRAKATRATWPRARAALENLAVAEVIEAARATGGHAHIVHLSSSDALPMIASARREGVRITAETCPHYLTLTAEEIGDGEAACKCSPPVREAANRELLWAGLREPDPRPGRLGPLAVHRADEGRRTTGTGAAWGGISSLQLGLPLTWTQARRRGLGLAQVAAWMAAAPARLAGLTAKGRIAAGCDADFCRPGPGGVLRGRPRPAVPPAPGDHPVRGPDTVRRGAAHPAARARDRPGPAAREAARGGPQ